MDDGVVVKRRLITLQADKNRLLWKRSEALQQRLGTQDEADTNSPTEADARAVGQPPCHTFSVDATIEAPEVPEAAGVGGFLSLTRSIVGVVLAILVTVAVAGSLSFLSMAFSMSRAVGMTTAGVTMLLGARNTTAVGELAAHDVPWLPAVRAWMMSEPLVTALLLVASFAFACYCNHNMGLQQNGLRRARNTVRTVIALATRHVVVIIGFMFIGYVLARAEGMLYPTPRSFSFRDWWLGTTTNRL